MITSHRAIGERLGLIDDPTLVGSALDRIANASYQIVIDGESYRQPLSPHRAPLEPKEELTTNRTLISNHLPAAHLVK